MIMPILDIFGFLKRNRSADVAKERLMMVLSYERRGLPSNFTEQLQKDLMQVFAKYPQFNLANMQINLKTESTRDELSICIPLNKDRR
jgi:cell division topological specificity factor